MNSKEYAYVDERKLEWCHKGDDQRRNDTWTAAGHIDSTNEPVVDIVEDGVQRIRLP